MLANVGVFDIREAAMPGVRPYLGSGLPLSPEIATICLSSELIREFRIKQMLEALLAPLERSNAFVWTALAVAVVLTLQIEPIRGWGGNEIHYFDLGLRSVSPEQFGPNHAAFDHSVARFASFAVLGGMVEFFGYDIGLI